MSVVPHLKGLHDYEYIAVLGRGHFGKVSWKYIAKLISCLQIFSSKK